MAIGTPIDRGTDSKNYSSATLVSNTFTPAANSLMLVWVLGNDSPTIPSGITGHDGGTSWVQIGSTQSFSNIAGTLWGAHAGASPSSGVIEVTLPNTSITQCNFCEITGVDVSGTVANSFEQTDAGVGSTSTMTRSLSGATEVTVGFWGNTGSENFTMEGTAVNQLNHPSAGTEAGIDYDLTGDTTPTAESDNSTGYVSFAVELKVAILSTLEQEGFQFRLDDGSESGATDEGAQDANMTSGKEVNRRIRFVIAASGDPDAQTFRLDYKRADDSDDEFRAV